MRVWTKLQGIALAGVFHFLFATIVHAGAPTDQIRGTVDKVLAILKNPTLKSEVKKEDRRNRLRDAIFSRFDFAEMAKRSLGTHWKQRTPEERREFVEIFAELLEGAYVDKIESYDGEKCLYGNEAEEQGHATVDTKILTREGKQYAIVYKLHPVETEWKVYDVTIENISLVNNYRSQFNRVLTKSSYAELLQRMKDKRFKAPEKH